jgi:hypothetical protein
VIFSAENEDGISLLELVLQGKKTVTRRRKPKKVGSTFAVQSKRGGKSLSRAKVVSCVLDEDWQNFIREHRTFVTPFFAEEARREGFRTWDGLWSWIKGHYGDDLPELYRIEFELIKP